jgi:hypothetical protein
MAEDSATLAEGMATIPALTGKPRIARAAQLQVLILERRGVSTSESQG